MKKAIGLVLFVALAALSTGELAAQDVTPVSVTKPKAGSGPATFTAPVRLKDGNKIIRIESPGYAAPCWADVDGDGKKDLLVGQFAGGKIKVYPGLGKGKIGVGEWLKVDGKTAEVPGVW